jgi:hypothetical protein
MAAASQRLNAKTAKKTQSPLAIAAIEIELNRNNKAEIH